MDTITAPEIIVLDPGHGGKDTGAQGEYVKEKDVNLAVAHATLDLINREDSGQYLPMVTRRHDESVSLRDRVAFASEVRASLFLSIHCNAFRSDVPYDLQVYHWHISQTGFRLAKCLFDALSPVDGGVSKWSRVEPNDNYYVLRNTACPAALIELDFISHPEREQMLNDPAMHREYAQGIVAGLQNYSVFREV